MEIYLTNKELDDMAKVMNAVVDAIFSSGNTPELETVYPSPPSGLLGLLGPKNRPEIIMIRGIRFATDEQEKEALVARAAGQNFIAVKVRGIWRSEVRYNVYTLDGYIKWLTRNGHRLLAIEARNIIGRTEWRLEQLLPEKHPLRTQPYLEPYSRD